MIFKEQLSAMNYEISKKTKSQGISKYPISVKLMLFKYIGSNYSSSPIVLYPTAYALTVL